MIKIKEFKGKTVLYEKTHIIENIKSKKNNLIIDKIIKGNHLEPYQAYQEIIKKLEMWFTEKAALTKKYWFVYVKNFLYTSNGSVLTLEKNVKRFVSITELLISVTKEKEIFAFSAKELNLLLFNEKVFLGYRESLYSFIKKVNESLSQKIINMELLNNPYAEKRQKEKLRKNKEIYSTKEFIALLNYVNLTELHKRYSLEDIDKLIGESRLYRKYDSAWLYILLHMNNGWRSSDVSSFPRVDLSNVGVRSLKEYKEKSLSVKDAEKIINQVRIRMPFIRKPEL